MKNKNTIKNSFSTLDYIKAWSVHLLTSTGVLAAFWALVYIGESNYRGALIALLVAQFIDGIDGSFARWWKVKEVLPTMDGKTIDYVIDFATYAIIPAYLFYHAHLCEPYYDIIAACTMLMVSAIYYGMYGMVTDDLHFKGFPVLWNFVVMYMLVVLQWDSMPNFILIMVLSIWHFIPTKFLYPSQTKKFFFLTLAVVTALGLAVATLIYIYPQESMLMRGIAIGGALYYMCLSLWNTFND